MKSVLLYGAIDRFNYGDLLFPIILKSQLEKLDNDKLLKISYYGIVNSDLSEYGALPSHSLNDFYDACKETPSHVIVVGGEVLQASWGPIFSYINPLYNQVQIFVSRLLRKYSAPINDRLAKFLLKGKTSRPFVIEPEHFPEVKGIIYNATGGVNARPYPDHIIQALNKSMYFSCREKRTFTSLKEKVPNLKLVPDSAILMSAVFDNHFLEKHSIASKSIPSTCSYVFFQINKRMASQVGVEDLSKKLKELALEKNLKIVLCPLATALGHEDPVPLQKIHQLLGKEISIFINNPSLWDIMYLISHSSLYIGSSLHGMITAMSFAVPYLGVANPDKMAAYIDTWAIDDLKVTNKNDKWNQRVDAALKVDKKKLEENRDYQVRLSEESVKEIYHELSF